MADVLEVIEVATTQLSGERYPTMSLVLPLAYGLRSQLAEADEDCLMIATFKAKLRDLLTERFLLDELSPSSLPVACAALDPRFHHLPFLSLQDREEVKQKLIRQASVVPEKNVTPREESQAKQEDAQEPPKKKKSKAEVILARLYMARRKVAMATLCKIPQPKWLLTCERSQPR